MSCDDVFPIVGLAFLWIALLTLTGWLGGWGRLAAHYRRTTQVGHGWRHFVTAYFGRFVEYGGSLRVAATADGLFLAAYLPWRPGHPPLYFPWEDMTVRLVPGAVWDYFEFRFTKEPRTVVYFTAYLGRKLLADAGRLGRPGLFDVE
jgi:hypothetical protein